MHDRPELLRPGVPVLYRGDEYRIANARFIEEGPAAFHMVTIFNMKGESQDVPAGTLVLSPTHSAEQAGMYYS